MSNSIETLLQWWLNPENLRQGIPLKPTPFTHHLFTDASQRGWGAFLQDTMCQGTWSPEESIFHINNLEMRADKLALCHFNIPPRSHILVASDNITVMAYINKVGGTRSRSLWKETESLFSLTISLNLSIHARYIPGKMNVIAEQARFFQRSGHSTKTLSTSYSKSGDTPISISLPQDSTQHPFQKSELLIQMDGGIGRSRDRL